MVGTVVLRCFFKISISAALSLLLLALASGCTALQSTALRTSTDRIEQRSVEYVLAHNPSKPTVVFESGLGGTLDLWSKILPAINEDAATFAYNRPGYGNSTAVATERSGAQIVDELRALLQSKNLQPPYVLVGHSLGGLYMQLYARRYPSEVAGMVLISPMHPAQLQDKGPPQNWPAWARLVFMSMRSETEEDELVGVYDTGKAVLALPTVATKPVIVLRAGRSIKAVLMKPDDDTAADIVSLYPGAKEVVVDSGHDIPNAKPEAVIKAVRDMLRDIGRTAAQQRSTQ